jgi:hypothetical protein
MKAEGFRSVDWWAAQLRCYVAEPIDETWGRLRNLGARREQSCATTGRQDERASWQCVARGSRLPEAHKPEVSRHTRDPSTSAATGPVYPVTAVADVRHLGSTHLVVLY